MRRKLRVLDTYSCNCPPGHWHHELKAQLGQTVQHQLLGECIVVGLDQDDIYDPYFLASRDVDIPRTLGVIWDDVCAIVPQEWPDDASQDATIWASDVELGYV